MVHGAASTSHLYTSKSHQCKVQRVKSLKNEWRAGNSAGLASPRSSETSAITCIHGDRNNALYQESITKPEHIKGWGSQVKIFRKDQDESNQQYQMFRWFHAYLRIAEDLKACRGWSRFPSFSPSKPGDPCSVWLPAQSAERCSCKFMHTKELLSRLSALTMARARLAGSSDLKMPLPTSAHVEGLSFETACRFQEILRTWQKRHPHPAACLELASTLCCGGRRDHAI